MERRTVVMAATAVVSLTVLAGCTTTKGESKTATQKMAEIDTGADATLARLYSSASGRQVSRHPGVPEHHCGGSWHRW
jgi:outer membrane murein-binding lipoprotein Lpp